MAEANPMSLPEPAGSAKALGVRVSLPPRTFTIRDTLVLVGATCVGLGWVHALRDRVVLDRWQDWLAPENLGLVLMPWTFALVGLRLLPPRPLVRRLAFQPGAAACGAVAFTFLWLSCEPLLFLLAENHGPRWAQYLRENLANRSYSSAIEYQGYDAPVVLAWGYLWVSRRCRIEPTWIDRTGRAIGLIWLLSGFWLRWVNHGSGFE
jgi:hypothetical protein